MYPPQFPQPAANIPSILDIQVSVFEIRVLCSKLPMTVQNGQFCIPHCNYPGLSRSTMMLMSMQNRYWNTTILNMQKQCPLWLHLHHPVSPLLHQITCSWPALLITPSLVPPLLLLSQHWNLCPNTNNTWPWSTERWILKHSIPPCFGGRYNHSCNMSSAYFSLNIWLRLIKPGSPFSHIWHVISCNPQSNGVSWMPLLMVSTPLHWPMVKLEGGHAYTGYVYERMVARGTHEVGLSVPRL